MMDFNLRFVGTVSDDELKRLLKPENREELKQRMGQYKCGNCRYFTRNCKDYNGQYEDGCIYHLNDTDAECNACEVYEQK